MEDKMILGAWLTEEDLQDICSDLGVVYEDALDKLNNAGLELDLNEYLIEMVWEELKEDDSV